MIALVEHAAPEFGVVAACAAIGLPRASYYRSQREVAEPKPRPKSKRALTDAERQVVLDMLHEPRFVDRSPDEIHAQLLDENVYLCSRRTMYRILADNEEVRERRRQTTHPPRAVPRLCATAPNQVWSWDITKLHGPHKWTYFYLYVVLDLFSRHVVGWLLATKESATLAQRLLTQTCKSQGIERDTLTLHQDRGSPMTSKTFAQACADLGVTTSFSRPRVSNDNPFSESQFKTFKYQPDFPGSFDDIAHAKRHTHDFIEWYNNEHHHAGIGFMTPSDVHHGLAAAKWHARAEALAVAYAAHPERFSHGPPTPPALPTHVWINQPSDKTVTPTSAP
jgi:putative transposase